jgi:hypothetical protein
MPPTIHDVTLAASSFDAHVVQRVLEFCHPATPWWRRLWQAGTVLVSRELLEAGDPAMSASEYAKAALLRELSDRIVRDPGCGPAKQRASNKKMLTANASSLQRYGHNWSALQQYTENLRANYLKNWAVDLRAAAGLQPTCSPEATARLLTSYLLEEGCSDTFVHRWLTYHVRYDTTVYTLADLVDLLHERIATAPTTTEVLITLDAEVPLPRPIPPGWLTAKYARHWRAENIPNSKPIRQHGGLLLTVTANDIYAAADLVRERIVATLNKFNVGGRRKLVVGPHMWIKGVENPLPVAGSTRRVEVHSIERRGELWNHSMPSSVEAALELMAPLERGSVSAAITGAWAAIEGLLVGPGDDSKHVAVERMALITACASIRAELTSLAWAHRRASNDPLSADIQAAGTNKERARLTIAAIAGGATLTLPRVEDQHGLQRFTSLVGDPHAFVIAAARCLERSFGALYRQRNLLSHAGGTTAVALRPTLSRVAPLVAAGMDRVVDAAYSESLQAIELAARARFRVSALVSNPATSAVDLLG